jgi:hypothetical protein
MLERRRSRANPAAAFILLGTGVYLGSAGWWTQAWFHVSLAAWLANSLLVSGEEAKASHRGGPAYPVAAVSLPLNFQATLLQ